MHALNKKIMILIITGMVFLLVSSCGSAPVGKKPDTPPVQQYDIQKKVFMLADSVMIDHGKDLNLLEKKFIDGTEFYEVHYILRETHMLGGGGIIIISKTGLQVLAVRLYQ